MATPNEVYKSIKDHIYTIIDKIEKARNNGDLVEEERLNKKLELAQKYAEYYKNDYNLH